MRLACLFAATGAVSVVGLTIVDIVEDPKMAPLAIAGLLFTSRLRSPSEYSSAASFRRIIPQTVKDGLGDIFNKNDKVMSYVVNVCRAKFP